MAWQRSWLMLSVGFTESRRVLTWERCRGYRVETPRESWMIMRSPCGALVRFTEGVCRPSSVLSQLLSQLLSELCQHEAHAFGFHWLMVHPITREKGRRRRERHHQPGPYPGALTASGALVQSHLGAIGGGRPQSLARGQVPRHILPEVSAPTSIRARMNLCGKCSCRTRELESRS